MHKLLVYNFYYALEQKQFDPTDVHISLERPCVDMDQTRDILFRLDKTRLRDIPNWLFFGHLRSGYGHFKNMRWIYPVQRYPINDVI